MSARCKGEPVSWLRIERYHLGEVQEGERRLIAEHLGSCEACAACLALIEREDATPLPAIALPAPKRAARTHRSARMAVSLGALAAAAMLVIALRDARQESVQRLSGESRLKGDAVAFSLVRDDGERFAGATGVYGDKDRFKAVVTCPPGASLAFDLVVYDDGGAAFPIPPAPELACGNDVPVPGAFRLTGSAEERVCVAWSEGAPVNRAKLASGNSVAGQSLCKRFLPTAAP
jgi:anti-sigma factor RsiW